MAVGAQGRSRTLYRDPSATLPRNKLPRLSHRWQVNWLKVALKCWGILVSRVLNPIICLSPPHQTPRLYEWPLNWREREACAAATEPDGGVEETQGFWGNRLWGNNRKPARRQRPRANKGPGPEQSHTAGVAVMKVNSYHLQFSQQGRGRGRGVHW